MLFCDTKTKGASMGRPCCYFKFFFILSAASVTFSRSRRPTTLTPLSPTDLSKHRLDTEVIIQRRPLDAGAISLAKAQSTRRKPTFKALARGSPSSFMLDANYFNQSGMPFTILVIPFLISSSPKFMSKPSRFPESFKYVVSCFL